jgi:hypothetical protein
MKEKTEYIGVLSLTGRLPTKLNWMAGFNLIARGICAYRLISAIRFIGFLLPENPNTGIIKHKSILFIVMPFLLFFILILFFIYLFS